ncbi:DUF262 and DUF1524 domain-containing protein [bacterium]|nr:DUF262 and DUF1524 domain-containing protein [bacterium]
MNAKETNLLIFLNSNMQLIVPIYQRKYSWTEEECDQLWNDTVSVALNEEQQSHFLGSIVTMLNGTPKIGEPIPYLLIDGQQRLISISLLIKAFSEHIKYLYMNENLQYKKIQDYYLFNSVELGDLKYKLILTRHDKEIYEKILEDSYIDNKSESSLIFSNYQYFKKKIESKELNPDQLYTGLGKLMIVGISLTFKEDNPQLIFESLNSTGKELTQSDLIRNYFLMNLIKKDQDKLYTNNWFPMEKFFDEYYEKYNDDKKQLDWFFRDYITYKTKNIPTQYRIYESFKKTFRIHTVEDAEILIKDIFYKATLYNRFALLMEQNPEINKALVDIDDQKANVTYPFFLELFEDYDNKILTHSELLEVLELISSYLFRRWIVGIPSNALNTVFSTLTKGINKEDYLNSLKAKMVLLDGYQKFPTDEEFVQLFPIKDIYNSRNVKYVLSKFENLEHKETFSVNDYTIEHIMPQTISASWMQALGENWKEVHSKLLHTIGNLTLTGYNTEYSNKPFQEKRDKDPGGFKKSHLFLNHKIAELETWNDAAIKNRAEELTNIALKIWKFPVVEQSVLDRYQSFKVERTNVLTLEIEDILENTSNELAFIMRALREKILSFHSSVKERVYRSYIGYKTTTNFLEVYVSKSLIRILLTIDRSKLSDPLNICLERNHQGTSVYNCYMKLLPSNINDIDYITSILKQAFDEHFNFTR